MIVEVSLYNRPQPFPELRHGQMFASPKLLLQRSPAQHRRRIGRRSSLLSPAVAASAEPIDQRRSEGKHSRATVMPPNLAEFPVPSLTIALLPILPLSTTYR